jgi:hypothetical protein
MDKNEVIYPGTVFTAKNYDPFTKKVLSHPFVCIYDQALDPNLEVEGNILALLITSNSKQISRQVPILKSENEFLDKDSFCYCNNIYMFLKTDINIIGQLDSNTFFEIVKKRQMLLRSENDQCVQALMNMKAYEFKLKQREKEERQKEQQNSSNSNQGAKPSLPIPNESNQGKMANSNQQNRQRNNRPPRQQRQQNNQQNSNKNRHPLVPDVNKGNQANNNMPKVQSPYSQQIKPNSNQPAANHQPINIANNIPSQTNPPSAPAAGNSESAAANGSKGWHHFFRKKNNNGGNPDHE